MLLHHGRFYFIQNWLIGNIGLMTVLLVWFSLRLVSCLRDTNYLRLQLCLFLVVLAGFCYYVFFGVMIMMTNWYDFPSCFKDRLIRDHDFFFLLAFTCNLLDWVLLYGFLKPLITCFQNPIVPQEEYNFLPNSSQFFSQHHQDETKEQEQNQKDHKDRKDQSLQTLILDVLKSDDKSSGAKYSSDHDPIVDVV
jgi:hypothetical protein